jgi:uncharacterized protein (DUF1778 family)
MQTYAIRLSPENLRSIKRAAARAGLRPSAFIREAARKAADKVLSRNSGARR